MVDAKLEISEELKGKAIFLSASFPQREREERYFVTSNPLEISDAVIAVARAVFSRGGKLLFGGHPTISPLLLSVGKEFFPFFKARGSLPLVIIYQSRAYEETVSNYTLELAEKGIGEIKWIDRVNTDKEKNLSRMRQRMMEERNIIAAIFIGGMEGVEDEFALFVQKHPENPVYPIGSCGGAAKILLQGSILGPMKESTWRFKWEYKDKDLPHMLSSTKVYPSLMSAILFDLLGRESG